ncbi:MAG: hypothetical protein H0W09_08225 [Solirubrobacterales bacterium]|nr:hypothetical protein [Solirubrobacterales bacterium]
MAILTMFEVHGDPDEIVAKQDEAIMPRAMELAPQTGGISNTIVKTEDGVMIVNLWEDEEGMRKFSEEIRPLAQGAGLEQTNWRMFEVLRHRTPDA